MEKPLLENFNAGGGFGGKKESGQLRFGGRDRPFRKPIITNQSWKNYGQEQRGQRKGLTHLDNYDRYSERDTRLGRHSSHLVRSPDQHRRKKSTSQERSRRRTHQTSRSRSRSPRDKRNRHHDSSDHKHHHKHKHKHRHERQ